MKKYTNGKWTYQIVNNIVCVFNQDKQLIKTISQNELQTLIRTGVVK